MIPLRDLTFGVTRDRMKRFMGDLRKATGVLGSVWWVEKDQDDPYATCVHVITRGGPWGPTEFRKLAHERGLERREITDFSWCPTDDPGAAEAWRAALLERTLRTPRSGLTSRSYGATMNEVILHKRLNGRDMAHPSRGFFVDGDGNPLDRESALRKASRWRRRGGWLQVCFYVEILMHEEEDGSYTEGPAWRDSWWQWDHDHRYAADHEIVGDDEPDDTVDDTVDDTPRDDTPRDDEPHGDEPHGEGGWILPDVTRAPRPEEEKFYKLWREFLAKNHPDEPRG
jgi:hypothetical protein